MSNLSRLEAVADGLDTAISTANLLPSASGSEAPAIKDINFYDYDGVILHSYTIEEIQKLTELPPLPERDGFVCQGWNWSLDDIKDHNRQINVGAMYVTDDGKTRIYIHLEEGRTSPMLGVCPNGSVTVDWGDGSTPDVITGTDETVIKFTPTHTYASGGDYIISLSVDGTMGVTLSELLVCDAPFFGDYGEQSEADLVNAVYSTSIQKVEIGSGVTGFYGCTRGYEGMLRDSFTSINVPRGVVTIDEEAFVITPSLTTITLPDTLNYIGMYAFAECYFLTQVILPNSLTSIAEGAFEDCSSLASIIFPDSLDSIDYAAFRNCRVLTEIVLPNNLTYLGDRAFSGCRVLTSANFPSSLTTTGSDVFYGCELKSIVIPEGITEIGAYACSDCLSLASIKLPAGLITIGEGAFCGDTSLKSIVIPDSVTEIGEGAFADCSSLVSVKLSSNLTTIGEGALYSCFNLHTLDCSNCLIIPELSSEAFSVIWDDFTILIPDNHDINDWKSATNWADYADYMRYYTPK